MASAGVTHSPVPPRTELARWDTLPSIGPLIDWKQHQPRYLAVTVDHLGADLHASGWGLTDISEEAGTTDRYPVSVNNPGGWSQRHYQRHAIENWAKSAREVAQAVIDLVDRVGPEVILVGGDPRSVSLLEKALPKRSPFRWRLPGCRGDPPLVGVNVPSDWASAGGRARCGAPPPGSARRR